MKRILSLASLVLLCHVAMAQWNIGYGASYQHNLEFEVNGGLGGLLINNSLSLPTKMGIAAGGHIGYTYMVNPKSGVHIGIGVTYMTSKLMQDRMSSLYGVNNFVTHDNSGTYVGDANIVMNTDAVEENYTTIMARIPIQYSFRNNNFWLNLGISLAVPVIINADYAYGATHSRVQTISQTGTVYGDPAPYPQGVNLNAESGNYSAGATSDAGITLFASLVLEMGYRVKLNHTLGTSLYIGVYGDLAINSKDNSEQKPFIAINKEDASTATAEDASFTGALLSSGIEGFKPLSGGVKVYYSIGIGRPIRRYGMR